MYSFLKQKRENKEDLEYAMVRGKRNHILFHLHKVVIFHITNLNPEIVIKNVV